MRLIKIIVSTIKEKKIIVDILKKSKIVSYNLISNKKMHKFEIITINEETGPIVEKLKDAGFGKSFKDAILIMDVSASVPKRRTKEIMPKLSKEEVENNIKQGGGLTWIYLSFMVLSSIIVALGMLGNNIIVVIGGMVIAPLLFPMMGNSYYLINKNHVKNMKEGIISEMWGIFMAIFGGLFIGSLTSNFYINPLIVGRSVVSFFDIGVAIFAGAAGTLSVSTGKLGELSGVAIAVALVPPAVTIGIGIALGNMAIITGASMLTLINIVCLHFSSMITFAILGYTS